MVRADSEAQPLKRLERANKGVGLRCFQRSHPENPEPGMWSASWWNGPRRKTVSRVSEAELMMLLFDVFGRPEDGDDGRD